MPWLQVLGLFSHVFRSLVLWDRSLLTRIHALGRRHAWVEERIKFSGPESLRVSFGTGKIYRSFGMGTTLTPKQRIRGVSRTGQIVRVLESGKFYALFHSGVEPSQKSEGYKNILQNQGLHVEDLGPKLT